MKNKQHGNWLPEVVIPLLGLLWWLGVIAYENDNIEIHLHELPFWGELPIEVFTDGNKSSNDGEIID